MNLQPAIDALTAGHPVVIPTDTVYGLGALARDARAVGAIFALKQRPVDTRIAALVADVQQAEQLVQLGHLGRLLADAFWPGALTIVAPRHPGLDLAVGDAHTVGVRCPDNEIVRSLARRVGPLAVTSANLHGRDPSVDAAEIAALFPGIEMLVADSPFSGTASTVVAIIEDAVSVVREGAVTLADIHAVLGVGS